MKESPSPVPEDAVSAESSEAPVLVAEKSSEQSPGIAPESSGKSWGWYLSPRMWLRVILNQNDTPHSLALGTAIGTFASVIPAIGLQAVIVIVLAWMIRPLSKMNHLAGLIAITISNPLTALPIYWFNYWVGTFFFPGNLTRERLESLLEYQGFSGWWKNLCEITVDIGWPLMFGSILVGVVSGLLAYPLVYWLASSMQKRKQQKQNSATESV